MPREARLFTTGCLRFAVLLCGLALLLSMPARAAASPGQVFAFGNNEFGQLATTINNGTATANSNPAFPELPNAATSVVQLAAGHAHTLVLTSVGQLYAFGENRFGQLGYPVNNGTDNPNPTPLLLGLPGATGLAMQIAAGQHQSLVLTGTGQLYAFGENRFGQLGRTANNGTSTANPTPELVILPGATGSIVQIAAGGRHSLALTSTGQLYAFGENRFGQLGSATNNGTEAANPSPTRVTLPGAGGEVVQVSAGDRDSFALTSTGQLYAFGENRFGQLGSATNNGTEAANPTPTLVSVPGSDGRIVQVSAGNGHTAVLTSSGQVLAFGGNRDGALGTSTNLGTENANPTPLRVDLPGAIGSPVQAVAGELQTFVVTSSGQLFAFGNNLWGQLGIQGGSGTNAPNAPSLVGFPFGTTIDTVARGAESEHTLALVGELSVTTAVLPAGQVGVPYHATAASSGGTGGFAWRATGLPPGLSIAPDGEISGTPTSAGATSVRLSVTDIFGLTAASAAIPMTIAPAPIPPTPEPILPKTPTTAQIRASLLAQLGISGKPARIAVLGKRKSYSYSFKALTAGTLTIGWYLLPKGAHLAKRKPTPVLFAGGGQSFSAPGTKSVKITLTSRGRQLLRHHGHLGITARGIFTPAAGPPITATKPIKLTR